MHKWQKEDKEQRAVFCIAVYGSNSYNTLYGASLPLIAALTSVMLDDSTWAEICKGALEAIENPIAGLALVTALEKAKKERETPPVENEDKTVSPSIKESLKTILSKLADKL